MLLTHFLCNNRPCHPGPCPPCLLSIEKPCHCGRELLVMRCSRYHEDPRPSLSCDRKCDKPLSCGNHSCQQECHEGPCEPCAEMENVTCYCGRNRRTVPCGEGELKICKVETDGNPRQWEGRFECESLCEQPFACGIHKCEKVSLYSPLNT
jgi:transcriptional repressor NF-X1